MAPKQRRQNGGPDLALRQQLAEIKGVPLEQVGRIRMTPEKLPSLVDVGVVLTGKDARHTCRDVQAVLQKYPEVAQKVDHFHFGGQGQRNTPVPKDLAALIEIIFLLPGRAAAQVRRAAAQVFVRYLGGDLTLIGEVEHLNHVQAFLRENAPEHPMRAFGEAVEGEQAGDNMALKRKREEVELKKLEAEAEEAEARAREAKDRADAAFEARRIANINAWIQMDQSGGVVRMAPADRVAATDMMRTLALGRSSADGERGNPICLETFLRSKGVRDAATSRGAFGKVLLKVWREKNPGQEPPKKEVYVNGQQVLAFAYWDRDRQVFEDAYVKWRPVEEMCPPAPKGGLGRYFPDAAHD